jgi:hemerythrin superfamily protein
MISYPLSAVINTATKRDLSVTAAGINANTFSTEDLMAATASASRTVRTIKNSVIDKTRVTTGKDIIAQLKQDHKEVKALFEEFENLGARAVEQRKKLGTKITSALATHSEIEKNILYPAFKARAEDHDELEQVLEAFEEHALVDRLVAEIQNLDAKNETYEAKVKTLMDLVLHHVKEEEGQMFPAARQLFEKDELVAMAQEAESYR